MESVIRVKRYPPITKIFNSKIDTQLYSRDLWLKNSRDLWLKSFLES